MFLHAVTFVSLLHVVKPLDCCGPTLTEPLRDVTGPATPGVQVSSQLFGNVSGQPVFRFTIKTKDISVQVMNYGAYLTSITVPDKQGRSKDVLLGHDTLKEYVDNPQYFGATIGRVANRIANSSFTLDGKVYKLNPSGSRAHYTIKGGVKGWDKCVWKASTRADGVTFSLLSPDGDEIFRGAGQALLQNETENENSKNVKECVENIKNAHECVGNAMLIISTVPGTTAKVEGTPYDFCTPRLLKDVLPKVDYDTDLLVSKCHTTPNQMVRVAEAEHTISGRTFELYSDQPGIQLFTANNLPDPSSKKTPVVGKGGVHYEKHGAFCIISQIITTHFTM
ncbi:aldose 1-epimerase-like [Thrips palmi]|uniref:Galactose mutarotase n=1 Tax=Thrips palmi TaxID=161013 RepID=A0A6P8Y4X8_THRPL|nr:aldose 1-epimerase-like [Thrips palmi]